MQKRTVTLTRGSAEIVKILVIFAMVQYMNEMLSSMKCCPPNECLHLLVILGSNGAQISDQSNSSVTTKQQNFFSPSNFIFQMPVVSQSF